MTPDDELRGLLERVTELVLDNVDKEGWSIPIGLGHSPAGERIYLVADSSDQEEEYDPEKYAQSTLAQIRSMAKEGQIRAVAFAEQVTCTLESDAGPEEATAVKLTLDHQDGGGYIGYLLYHLEDGKAVPEEIIYQDLDEPLFRRRLSQ
jgi:hypothetical protein